MSSSSTCAAPYCRRMVKAEYEYAPFCFDHKDLASQRQAAQGSSYEDQIIANTIRHPMPAGGNSDVYFTSSIISNSYGLSQKESYAISHATHELEQRYGDLTVPENADRVDLYEYTKALIDNGIENRRISIIEYRGYNVHNEMSENILNRFISAPSVSRAVVILDRGTDRELVIDPAISSLAIARDRSIPIENDFKWFPSGVTPFGDSPWVGKDSEYRDGAYMYWDYREDDQELNQRQSREFAE